MNILSSNSTESSNWPSLTSKFVFFSVWKIVNPMLGLHPNELSNFSIGNVGRTQLNRRTTGMLVPTYILIYTYSVGISIPALTKCVDVNQTYSDIFQEINLIFPNCRALEYIKKEYSSALLAIFLLRKVRTICAFKNNRLSTLFQRDRRKSSITTAQISEHCFV